MAGTVLNIKPVICLNDGVIGVLGKARGSKQGNNLLVREIEKSGGIDFSRPVMLGYTGISDALLLKYIEDSKWLWQERLDRVRYSQIGSGSEPTPGRVRWPWPFSKTNKPSAPETLFLQNGIARGGCFCQNVC